MIIPNIWENKKWQPNHQPDFQTPPSLNARVHETTRHAFCKPGSAGWPSFRQLQTLLPTVNADKWNSGAQKRWWCHCICLSSCSPFWNWHLRAGRTSMFTSTISAWRKNFFVPSIPHLTILNSNDSDREELFVSWDIWTCCHASNNQ